MEAQKPDIGYIKCARCIKGDHDRCIGRTRTRPFCGCRCPWLLLPWLEEITDVE